MNDQEDYCYDEEGHPSHDVYDHLADEVMSFRDVKLARVFEEREEIFTNVDLRRKKRASTKLLRSREIPFLGFTCEQCEFCAKCHAAFDPICIDGDCLMDR